METTTFEIGVNLLGNKTITIVDKRVAAFEIGVNLLGNKTYEGGSGTLP